jgi:HlyD family secretion protein
MKTGQLAVARQWIKRRWAMTLCIIVVLCAGGWWFSTGRQEEKKDIAPVKADNRVLSEGIVFPVRYAQMVMPVEGTIGEVLVQEGDMVKAGQPIIRLIRQEYQARVGSTRADISRAAAAVEQARVNLTDAERELDREKRLEAVGATSKQHYDQAKTAVDRNRAALAQSQAELMTQEARLAESEGQLDKTEIKAAISGAIAFLDVKVGEHAAVGTVLVRIADEAQWEIRSDDLTELTIAKVKKGDQVSLTFDGIPGLELPGKVKSIRPYGEKKRGDITYTVTIAPEGWDERLRWNMTAQLAITPSGL